MSVNFKWAVLAATIAAFGGWACGSDDGGGGKSGDICEEGSSSFDAKACLECLDKYQECEDKGICESEFEAALGCVATKCGSQFQAVADCRGEAYGSCSVDHPDMDDAFDACIDAKCASQNSAAESCARSNCSAEGETADACWASGCPEAAACS